MEFFFDLDGVLLDFEKAYLQFIREEYQPDLAIDFEPSSWSMAVDFPNLNVQQIWEEFIHSERFSDIPRLIDSEIFNGKFKKQSVFFVTNIPHKHRQQRINNLKKAGFHYNQLFLGGHENFGDYSYPSKSKIINLNRNNKKQVIFLDDHPLNCKEVQKNVDNVSVFLMNRPHNIKESHEGLERVEDFDHFVESILQK